MATKPRTWIVQILIVLNIYFPAETYVIQSKSKSWPSLTPLSRRISLITYMGADFNSDFDNEKTDLTIPGNKISRRSWMKSILISSTIVSSAAFAIDSSGENKDAIVGVPDILSNLNSTFTTSSKTSTPAIQTDLNISVSVEDSSVDVKRMCTDEKVQTCTTIDRKNYAKVTTNPSYPSWFPEMFKPKKVTYIPNTQILVAGIIAGSTTEVLRTTLLYPLSTIKTRIQADNKQKKEMPPIIMDNNTYNNTNIDELIYDVRQNLQDKIALGDLYAGILPAILGSVPSSGVYFGVRDVTKRILETQALTPSKLDDLFVSIVGAVIGDIASVSVRIPFDGLVYRQQVGIKDDKMGNWLKESLENLPLIILTDLPYILIRIGLRGIFTLVIGRSNVGIGQNEILTVIIACIAAFVSTPFDVAKTRILLNRRNLKDNEETIVQDDSFRKKGLLNTFYAIITEETEENNIKHSDSMPEFENLQIKSRGVQNLFAGCTERVLYLGLGLSWFDPLRIIGYFGIRDAILLEWFE